MGDTTPHDIRLSRLIGNSCAAPGEAWRGGKSGSRCRRAERPGVCGTLEENLRGLLERAKSGTYHAPPVRHVRIRKGRARRPCRSGFLLRSRRKRGQHPSWGRTVDGVGFPALASSFSAPFPGRLGDAGAARRLTEGRRDRLDHLGRARYLVRQGIASLHSRN